MIADHLTGIEQFEADLWKIADNPAGEFETTGPTIFRCPYWA